MQNIKLAIQYDGTRYLGWQRPENDGYRRTVSYKIKEVLNRMTGEDIILHAGSRPGPGVHALAQTVSFQTEAPLEPADFLREAFLAGYCRFPYRGAEQYEKGDWVYKCTVQGEPDWFYGYEEILCRGIRVYECAFHGGQLC